jgi:hypothetical protein
VISTALTGVVVIVAAFITKLHDPFFPWMLWVYLLLGLIAKNQYVMGRPLFPQQSPVNVWVEYPDGARFENLPLVYGGVEDREHLWMVVEPRSDHPEKVGVDTMPYGATVEFSFPPANLPETTHRTP